MNERQQILISDRDEFVYSISQLRGYRTSRTYIQHDLRSVPHHASRSAGLDRLEWRGSRRRPLPRHPVRHHVRCKMHGRDWTC